MSPCRCDPLAGARGEHTAEQVFVLRIRHIASLEAVLLRDLSEPPAMHIIWAAITLMAHRLTRGFARP
ncbi:hypothetical protein GCM10027612_87580 [Microbispora bryophytorum subsp. camponoti]